MQLIINDPSALVRTELLHAEIAARKDTAMKNENIPQEALLRLPQVLNLIPVSRSAWWAGVKSGKFPQRIKLGERTTCWRKSDILALIDNTKKEGE